MMALRAVIEKACKNNGCGGVVRVEEENAVPFEGCDCFDKAYPCDACGLLHHESGRYLYKNGQMEVGVFKRNGRIVCRPMNPR